MSRTDYDLTAIRGVVFDVDGVLSCQTVSTGPDGNPMRTSNLRDGFAIHYACKIGFPLAIITGGQSPTIQGRYSSLGMTDIYMGASMKIEVLNEWLALRGLKAEEVAYVGDDLPDLEVMRKVGLAVCPRDAAPEVRATARYISPVEGGRGVARDILELIFRAQGKWPTTAEACGW